MFDDDPDRMSAEERLGRAAALLAAEFPRLKRHTGCVPAGVTGLDSRWRLGRTAASRKCSSSASAASPP